MLLFSAVAFNVARLSVLLCSPIELPVSIFGRPVVVVAQRRGMCICIQLGHPQCKFMRGCIHVRKHLFIAEPLKEAFTFRRELKGTSIGEHETHSDYLQSILTDSEFKPSLTVVYGRRLLAAGYSEAQAVQLLAAFVRQFDETCDGLYSNVHCGSILYIFSQKEV